MQVIWRKRANEELRTILHYGQEVFGEQIMKRFYDQINWCETLISSNPSMGVVEPLLAHRRTMYRSLVVHKHYKLIYWVDEKREVLYISDFWDTRCAPASLAGRI